MFPVSCQHHRRPGEALPGPVPRPRWPRQTQVGPGFRCLHGAVLPSDGQALPQEEATSLPHLQPKFVEEEVDEVLEAAEQILVQLLAGAAGEHGLGRQRGQLVLPAVVLLAPVHDGLEYQQQQDLQVVLRGGQGSGGSWVLTCPAAHQPLTHLDVAQVGEPFPHPKPVGGIHGPPVQQGLVDLHGQQVGAVGGGLARDRASVPPPRPQCPPALPGAHHSHSSGAGPPLPQPRTQGLLVLEPPSWGRGPGV